MSERKDGGQAFPHGDETHGGMLGMTLRDYFAAQALQGMFACGGHRDVYAEISRTKEAFCLPAAEIAAATNERVAAMAYAMADAMLKERAK